MVSAQIFRHVETHYNDCEVLWIGPAGHTPRYAVYLAAIRRFGDGATAIITIRENECGTWCPPQRIEWREPINCNCASVCRQRLN